MATLNPMVAHCIELLSPLGPVRVRRMFGGHGFYVDDLFMALLARDALYLKADETVRGEFEAAGSQPFSFETAAGRRGVMGYWLAPDEAMETPEAMRHWARLAMASALRAANAAARPPSNRAARPSRKAASPRKARAATPSKP